MKPSKIKSVRAKLTKLLPSAFSAITWKGTIYCITQSSVEAINKTDGIDSVLENHETIHVRQAESTKDSWFRFYLEYIWEWIKNLPLIFGGWFMPYYFMPMELEAYACQEIMNYTLNGPVTGWKKLKKLKIKEKYSLINLYKERKRYNYKFHDFAKDEILPLINEG